MKKLILLTVLIGGAVVTTYAQRGYGHGRGHGNGHYKSYERYDRRHCDYRRYDDCRPRRVVVYDRPRYRPAYYVPAPPPVAVIPVPVPVARPRAVFHAGVTIVN
ncbi:hypothetical protein [Chitinophaga sp. sic0106]|uniref:hypothetical protein n=1 Tax=Chitinophaga sp. sic0106 TaxID=2854785 RepID=UPI001C447489|nr:hypothetical protein [Chitinophaga sp. sic0106]MBV7530598.1 hypothetical protein [Chitinophaga sp. sic0106]